MADIELVIKIPEEEYRWIIKSDETVFADIASKECMLHAIKNGTPLPKGHGDLVDISPYKGKVICSHLYSGVKKLIEVDSIELIIEADKED
jgi:hypothetical protein